MGETTGISWTDHTFNPWHGCSKVSAECTNCYAEAVDHRYFEENPHWGVNAPRRFFGDKHWNEPLRWNRAALADGVRRRVFCASMADVFEDRPDLIEHRTRLWELIEATPALDWLLLTKRPEMAAVMLPWSYNERQVMGMTGEGAPWPNVWLGVTAGTRETMSRVQILRMITAAVRFVSCEPLLEHITAADWDLAFGGRPQIINWLIVGDESGAKRRPAQADWVRTAREAALRHGVAFHFKQWCGATGGGIAARAQGGPGRKIHLPILDGQQWAQFPGANR